MEQNKNTKATELLEIYYQISEKANDISILSFIVDYKEHLVEALDTLKEIYELEDCNQIANSVVKTYYLSGNYNKIDFSEFLAHYLKGLKESLEVFKDLDKNKSKH